MKFYGNTPANVFKKEYVDEHEHHIDVIWQEIVQLNTNLYLIKKITSFPFHLFNLKNNNIFWDSIADNMIQVCIMIIHKINFDMDSDALTLNKIKNDMLQNILNENLKKEFSERLKNINFTKKFKLNRIEEKIKILRDKRFAHIDRDYITNLTLEDRQIPREIFDKLEPICNFVNENFDALTIEKIRGKTFFEYSNINGSHPPGMEKRSDIEMILDFIAESDALLNMPENEPDYWPYQRKNLSESDINILNEYREKFNLPKV